MGNSGAIPEKTAGVRSAAHEDLQSANGILTIQQRQIRFAHQTLIARGNILRLRQQFQSGVAFHLERAAANRLHQLELASGLCAMNEKVNFIL